MAKDENTSENPSSNASENTSESTAPTASSQDSQQGAKGQARDLSSEPESQTAKDPMQKAKENLERVFMEHQRMMGIGDEEAKHNWQQVSGTLDINNPGVVANETSRLQSHVNVLKARQALVGYAIPDLTGARSQGELAPMKVPEPIQLAKLIGSAMPQLNADSMNSLPILPSNGQSRSV